MGDLFIFFILSYSKLKNHTSIKILVFKVKTTFFGTAEQNLNEIGQRCRLIIKKKIYHKRSTAEREEFKLSLNQNLYELTEKTLTENSNSDFTKRSNANSLQK